MLSRDVGANKYYNTYGIELGYNYLFPNNEDDYNGCNTKKLELFLSSQTFRIGSQKNQRIEKITAPPNLSIWEFSQVMIFR